jgi:hypothetical protein
MMFLLSIKAGMRAVEIASITWVRVLDAFVSPPRLPRLGDHGIPLPMGVVPSAPSI